MDQVLRPDQAVLGHHRAALQPDLPTILPFYLTKYSTDLSQWQLNSYYWKVGPAGNSSCPWLLIPAGFVVVTVLAFNFLGDGLRDAADPYEWGLGAAEPSWLRRRIGATLDEPTVHRLWQQH